MRLGLVIYGSLNTLTGGFIYDRNLVRHLHSRGDLVEIIPLPWRPYGLSLMDNLSDRLYRQLRQEDFEILLQDELVHPSFFWLNHRLRPWIDYPIITIVHHLRCLEHHPPYLHRLYRAIEQRYLGSADGFVCVSHTTANDVARLAGNRQPRIIASPGRDGLPGEITRKEIVARTTDGGPFQIIFVGNLIPRKELHTLLTAVAGLPQGAWRLTVVGRQDMDISYVKAIRRQIKTAGLSSQVTLLGPLPRHELAARLRASHLLAVPSSYEGFGIVYLEGMHFGLPAIASTSGAAREIVHHGHNGFLVPPGDAAALTRYLALLMQDREQLSEMSLTAHRSAAGHNTWEGSAALVRAFLQSFVVT